MKIAVMLMLALTFLLECRADDGRPVRECVGSSRDGRFIVRLATKIQVFTLDAEEKGYHLIAEFQPASPYLPLKALISDDGRYVVTLDGGMGMGRGDHVVTAYESTGSMLKSWSLEGILVREDRALVTSTAGSDWWRSEVLIAFRPPQLIVTGPNERFGPAKRRYWYQLNLETLKWEKRQ